MSLLEFLQTGSDVSPRDSSGRPLLRGCSSAHLPCLLPTHTFSRPRRAPTLRYEFQPRFACTLQTVTQPHPDCCPPHQAGLAEACCPRGREPLGATDPHTRGLCHLRSPAALKCGCPGGWGAAGRGEKGGHLSGCGIPEDRRDGQADGAGLPGLGLGGSGPSALLFRGSVLHPGLGEPRPRSSSS